MICRACKTGDHEACDDKMRLHRWVEWLRETYSEETESGPTVNMAFPGANTISRVTHPYTSCDCQHKVPAVD